MTRRSCQTLGNMNADRAALQGQIASAFAAELVATPKTSLRGAAEIDIGRRPPAFDLELDSPSPAYLEQHAYDLPFLDAESWRIYLPRLLALAVSHVGSSDAVDGLLSSLRPPDTEPPRFASLSAKQEAAVVAVLDFLAFGEESAHSAAACTALEEWWGTAPLYRPRQNVA